MYMNFWELYKMEEQMRTVRQCKINEIKAKQFGCEEYDANQK